MDDLLYIIIIMTGFKNDASEIFSVTHGCQDNLGSVVHNSTDAHSSVHLYCTVAAIATLSMGLQRRQSL